LGIRFLQRAVGYALTGDISEQVLFFLYGAGANGKSTFARVLLDLLGDYATQGAPDLLLAKRNESHPTEVADLLGCRLVVCQEIEAGRAFAEVTVKQLTGGDLIKARRMREDFWSFAPTHKFFVAANHKPPVRGTDHAIWRRIRLVPFTVRITDEERDPNLLEKLRAELAGVLAWAVEGCLEWQRIGLCPPDEVLQATSDYRGEQDLLAAFLEERCEAGMYFSVRSGDLYHAYSEWCEGGGFHPANQQTLGEQLREKGFEPFKGTKGARRWRGLRLKTEFEMANEGETGESDTDVCRRSGIDDALARRSN
jgi:putative DNA primase/helicase